MPCALYSFKMYYFRLNTFQGGILDSLEKKISTGTYRGWLIIKGGINNSQTSAVSINYLLLVVNHLYYH